MKRVGMGLLLIIASSSVHAGLDFLHRNKTATAPLIATVAPGPAAGQIADVQNPKIGLLLQRRAYGVIDAPVLDAYLQGILHKLQKTWPKAPRPARVYVNPAPSFTAYGTNDGAIFVSSTMLESVESEDELAALLAHEYAHILLDHHATNALNRFSARLYGLGTLYLNYRFGQNGASDLLLRQFAANEVGLQLMQAGLSPALSRKQESAADQLGTDLLIRAGYNPLAMHEFLDRMVGWEERDVEADKQSRQRYKQIVAIQQTGNNISISLQPLAEDLMGSAQDLYSRIRKTHPRAEQRRDDERTYVKSFYADAERPQDRPLPWQGAHANPQMTAVFRNIAEVRKAQAALVKKDSEAATMLAAVDPDIGHSGYADYARLTIETMNGRRRGQVTDVQAAVRRPGSLFQTHYIYLAATEKLDRKQAVVALEESRAELSDPPELLPYSIRIYRHAGDTNRAALYSLKCQVSGDKALMTQCEQASKS